MFFFFSSRRRHTRWPRDWSSDVCSSDLFVADIFLAKTTAECLSLLDEADIPSMKLQTPEGVIEDEHLKAVGFFRLIDHPSEGRIRTMGIPSTWSRSQPDIRREAPR